MADSFGLPKAAGALISGVEKAGPADKAGVRPSDVILKFDGKSIASSADLPRIVAATKPGNKVPVQLWRKGSTLEVSLMVGEIQDEMTAQRSGKEPGSGIASESENRLGLAVSELNEAQKAELQIDGGLLVEDVKGAAARSELQRGDVILAIGNIEIRTVQQFNEVLKKVPQGRNIALLVRRNDGTVYVPIRLDDK